MSTPNSVRRALPSLLGALTLVLAALPLQAHDWPTSTGRALDGSIGVENFSPSVPTPEAAQDLLGCEAGVGAACYSLGERYHGGRGVTRDHVASVFWILHACDLGYARACYDVGVRHLLGEYLPVDPDLARERITTACNMNEAVACAFGATLYRDGVGGSMDLGTAVSMNGRACQLGYAPACTANLSRDIGHYEENLPNTAPAALQQLARECDHGLQQSCFSLGQAYQSGRDLPVEERVAQRLFYGACDWGLLPACEVLSP